MISIRRRLIIMLLSLIITIGGVTVFFTYNDAQHEVGELFDAQLAQSARVLDALILHQINKSDITRVDLNDIQNILNHITVLNTPSNNIVNENDNSGITSYERKIAFQIWNDKNELILRSASAPDIPLSNSSLKDKSPGYFDEHINNKRWRVFSLKTEDKKYFMQVGEQYEIRDELATDISKQLIRTSLLSLPILAILIWIAISKGLSPLGRIANEVTKRNKGNFKALDLEDIPLEIEPLTLSIDDLLKRLEEAFEKEQRFTDDAAHELRTPLAALKTQAQVALASNNDDEKERALKKIVQGVDRASHLVNQMLVIARMEKYPITNQSINLNELTSELLEQFKNKIKLKGLSVSFNAQEDVVVQSDITSLTILINNLLDNAIRYSPDKGEINISLSSNNTIVLSIENNAEVIIAEDLERVFDRFYRVPGTNVEGCGLGLSISKKISDCLGIRLSLDNKVDGSGIVAKMVW